MPVYVSVLTGKGASAIASIGLCGYESREILSRTFIPSGKLTPDFSIGRIYHGRIIDNQTTVDEVVVGCEGENFFSVHCHGNPLLAEKIVRLFAACGAETADVETLLAFQNSHSSVFQKEAIIEQQKSLTIEGVRIIQAQIHEGLFAVFARWQKDIDNLTVEDIHCQCRQILEHSIIASRIIHGVKMILVGPPNSGKSTLFNVLCGSQKAIVSDTPGTTRDWVSAAIHLRPLRIELIDAAGLDESIAHDIPDKEAQNITRGLLSECDCILYIDDAAKPSAGNITLPAEKPVIRVLNKADLLKNTSSADRQGILVSAKTGFGLDALYKQILAVMQVDNYTISAPAVFTGRQGKSIENMIKTNDRAMLKKQIETTVSDIHAPSGKG